ncbi:MAG TPA: GyrI-like domain-containing protein [Candidatus Angelobacter sp.]|nr:GyrI-like domain-containing protein [Candidatus Angelobacter sp.]
MASHSIEINEKLSLQPRFENGKPLLIAGLRQPFSAGGTTEQWQRLISYFGKIPGQVGNVCYGLCFETSKGMDYLAGVEVSGLSNLPADFSDARIPTRKYAVFTHHGHVSTLRKTLDAIAHEWCVKSGYEPAQLGPGEPNFFERYGEDFNPQTGMYGMEVWVPVKA